MQCPYMAPHLDTMVRKPLLLGYHMPGTGFPRVEKRWACLGRSARPPILMSPVARVAYQAPHINRASIFYPYRALGLHGVYAGRRPFAFP